MVVYWTCFSRNDTHTYIIIYVHTVVGRARIVIPLRYSGLTQSHYRGLRPSDDRLFGARRTAGVAVRVRVLQVLPGTTERRRTGRVPSRQRHSHRVTTRVVPRSGRVRGRPTAICLTCGSCCADARSFNAPTTAIMVTVTSYYGRAVTAALYHTMSFTLRQGITSGVWVNIFFGICLQESPPFSLKKINIFFSFY